MQGRRNTIVAREGVIFLLAAAIACGASLYAGAYGYAAGTAAVLVILVLVFRDPRRDSPAAPLGVISPVDGTVVSVCLSDKGVVQGEAHVVLMRIDALGTYTARSPVGGKIMDLRSIAGDKVVDYQTNALWIQTDERTDVIMQFRGYRFGLPPRAFLGYGERVAQGQRCAYLRLTRFAEVHLPISGHVMVKPGDAIVAGQTPIGKLSPG